MELSEIDRIEADLARTRERMRVRLNELGHHLAPRQMVDDALVRFRGGRGADFTDDLIGRAKANPLPAGIAGVAIAWLMAGRNRPVPESRGRPVIAVSPQPVGRESPIVSERPEVQPATGGRDRHSADTFINTGIRPMTRSNRSTISSVTANPFALGAAAALVGIIAGALIPTLRKEEEALGSVATKLRVAGRDLAQDVVDHGGQVVEETLAAAKGSADSHGLSGAKPVGELFADVKSGALAEDVRQVAHDTLQAGRDSTQTHLAGTTETAKPEAGTKA